MIEKKILDLGVEALCSHNDGWSKKFFVDKLEKAKETAETEEKDFIKRILAKAEVS